MQEITVKMLKQELMDTIKKIDKDKITVSDLKILAETVGVLANINDNTINYMDILAKASSGCFGYKPTTVSDLKGDE